MTKPKDIKYSTCKFCKNSNLMWENHNGKYVLFESYGLPHVCEVLEEQKKNRKENDKKQYEEYKQSTLAKVGQKCTACGGHGVLLGVIYMSGNPGAHCFDCDGCGVLTRQQADYLITQKRYQIWPSLKFGSNRGRRRW